MTHYLNPRCVQLDDVVDLDYYTNLILDGHRPPQDDTPSDSDGAPAEA